MYRLPMKLERTEEDRKQSRMDLKEAAKNPLVPGARIIRSADTVPVYDNAIGCRKWCYPLSEVNDMAYFCYIEKKKETDESRPWAWQSHPNVNLYFYVLEGEGTLYLGEHGFAKEEFDFRAEELVIVPRDIPYRMEGEWTAVCFHVKTGVYGAVAGNTRFPHPVRAYEKPDRPTQEEREALHEAGTVTFYDSLCSMEIEVCKDNSMVKKTVDLQMLRQDLPKAGVYNCGEIQREVTPVDLQTGNERNREEAWKNASVLGARVIKREDAPGVYNANAALKQSSYPLTWTDDIAICNLAEHKAESDKERPFDAHSHLDIEEYKFVLAGWCDVVIGRGDETCEEEFYRCNAGDLQILPRGLTHVDAGGYTAIVFHAKQSVFGKTPGTAMYPHMAYIYTRPPRPTKEEEAVLNNPGDLVYMNSRETFNVYAPNPILRVEKNPTDMLHLRPDLFPDEKEAKE